MSQFLKEVQSLKRLEAEVKSLKTTEEVATKIRVDLELEKRKKDSDKYIAVSAKNKAWVMKSNPDYKPIYVSQINRRRPQ